ncbi:MAG: cytochrome C [Bacteroidales bacterium]|nr:cytochrome C [Bacteroidales bacterium]MCB8998900.1 cytochrome C [Bacteroidales bacterium]
MKRGTCILFILLSFSALKLAAQLSPGDLSLVHSNLEGLSNCTQCHVLGNKVSDEKCLACHKEINERILNKKGYHASSEVSSKNCFNCHSEHNGKDFKLIRIDTSTFNHKLTGYTLSVPHAKKHCSDCHTPAKITDPKLKERKNTYLGVSTECLNCHEDYHQKTLSADCLKCHNPEAFKPVTKFDHNTSKFPLLGKHKTVDCSKCHKIETLNGKKYQQFKGLEFSSCTNCHADPHKNQFGQNCTQCHSEESFHQVKGMANFNHDKTGFPLEGKHSTVSCKLCHKNKITDPVKHQYCYDCHADYHNRQFVKDGRVPDCSQCHNVSGFSNFSYTIEQHNKAKFPLEGAHLAIPCFECHKKQEKWSFREIGINCKDCHKDIHQDYIQTKYYPDENCRICHTTDSWSKVSFDHSKTNFALTGSHVKQTCAACHIRRDTPDAFVQKFKSLNPECSSCHKDHHFNQFEKNGVTLCISCHDTENWKASLFDHNNTNFKLDGKHVDVPCYKCHKQEQTGNEKYVLYKIKEYKCESCHS